MRKKIFILIVAASFILTALSVSSSEITKNNYDEDYDPLVDVSVTVEILGIRSLEKEDSQIPFEEIIDKNSDPDFYVKVYIDQEEFTSNTWTNTKYIYNPDWSATYNVDDSKETVDIKIQLWDAKDEDQSQDRLCDISREVGKKGVYHSRIGSFLKNIISKYFKKEIISLQQNDDYYDVELSYNIKTGRWTGGDNNSELDISGYGRLNGCDDNTIYVKDRDCELWFNIYQNDYDNDRIPYWAEVNTYNSDPEIKDTGDPDNDGIAVDWEWRWGYDPFVYEDHETLDPDGDSLTNIEEYKTSEWGSDPFTKDVFVELDVMEEGPNGEKTDFPKDCDEIIRTAFNRQNILFHLDEGDMGGYEIIPFDDYVTYNDLYKIYNDYFLHNDEDNWRRGVFHYGVVVYKSESAAGFMFRRNAFQVSSSGHDNLIKNNPSYDRDTVYASAYMHELGHTFGFWPIPGHDHNSVFPWQAGYWINRPYKSCMNYGYMYTTVDYSDGSRRAPDLDDWDRMKLNYFQRD